MLILTTKLKGKTRYEHRKGDLEVIPTEITRVTKIQDSAWTYWASAGASSIILSMKREWKNMNQKQRIEAVLATIAEGNNFTYEIVTE